ncbi:sugar-binding domain-containing protein [Paraflavitalea speifideaquila]|uniref:sugar-binding domain-containing protein n=1 Tax=Paraflavitalea speifideaquila TaxID=3076558 RepID=UPI0028E46998|nr:sugar-binding domain-containing protein [Paraflavitalea speifideiaquila]
MDIAALAHLARKVQFIGKAYYTRRFTVPANWQSKQISLTLGRVLWSSSVWIDGVLVKENQESLVTPHQYDLTTYIKPGKTQQLLICVDNENIHPGINVYAKQYPAKESSEMAHAYTNHTQIKWNGILGNITLTARPQVHIEHIIIRPDLQNKKLHIRYKVNNPAGQNGNIAFAVVNPATGRSWPIGVVNSGVLDGITVAEIPFAKNAQNWNEFNPQLYQLVAVLKSAAGTDTVRSSFGLRELTTKAGDLYLNGNRIFIRGNLECIIFPLKGYPPMQLKEWKALFTTAKSYGLNSFRFHSWCPPAAAFEAADELGFYLQVELPHWSLNVGEDSASFAFLESEAHRILDTYGNHPSFLFFSMGNELEGDFSKLNNLVATLKAKDNRHLYSTTTFTFQKELTGLPQPQDDYYVTQWTKKRVGKRTGRF